MKRPLLSIVIPTKNRQKYALSIIQTILSIKDYALELVIQDNSDTNELENSIKNNIIDKRLKYNYDSSPMSTIHNFNNSMDNVEGKYICYIGDDDGVSLDIMQFVKWMDRNKIDALIGKNVCSYSWPSDKTNGKLTIYPFSGKIKVLDVNDQIKKFIKNGAVYYLKFGLAKVYHGIIKKECIERSKLKTGNYFGGLSPDIYASIATSLEVEKLIEIDYPLTIAGSSFESDKTHRTNEAKNLELKDAPHFNHRGKYNWSKLVPSIYSGASIWAESGIKALEESNRFDLISDINKYRLGAYIALDSPHNKKKITSYLYHYKIELLNYYLIKYFILLESFFSRFFNRINKVIKNNKTYSNNIESIGLAIKEIDVYCNEKNLNFENILKEKL